MTALNLVAALPDFLARAKILVQSGYWVFEGDSGNRIRESKCGWSVRWGLPHTSSVSTLAVMFLGPHLRVSAGVPIFLQPDKVSLYVATSMYHAPAVAVL